MEIEGFLAAFTGLLESLWEWVDRHLLCEWFWNISGVGKLTNCGKSLSNLDIYWISLLAAVRLDNGYLVALPDRVQRTARWLLAHENKEEGKGG